MILPGRHEVQEPSMVRKIPILFAALVALSATLASAASGAQPKKKEVDQGGRIEVLYQLGGKDYVLFRPEALAQAAVGSNVCILAKLALVREKEIELHGPALKAVVFRTAPGVKITAAPGTNMWLGGTLRKEGDTRVLAVEASAEMPSDLDAFAARWQELDKAVSVTPEDFFQLAWTLEQGERVATGLTKDDFDKYRDGIARAYRRGLELESKGLQGAEDKALAARVERLRKSAPNRPADLTEGNEAWYRQACKAFTEAHREAAQALVAGKPCEASQRQRLLAGLHLLVGRMNIQFVADKDAAAKVFLQGAAVLPDDPGLKDELLKLRYVFANNHWARADEGQKTVKTKDEKPGPSDDAAARLRSGEGLEKIVFQVDTLLGESNPGALMKSLDALPQDVARYALWQVAALPPSTNSLVVLVSALKAKDPVLRQDAGDLLVARGMAEAAKPLLEALAREEDKSVVRHALTAMARIPGAARIDALLLVLNTGSMPLPVRVLAGEFLGEETGQKLGIDAFNWNQWWQKNRSDFVKKEADKANP
jgi:hypothetical protein